MGAEGTVEEWSVGESTGGGYTGAVDAEEFGTDGGYSAIADFDDEAGSEGCAGIDVEGESVGCSEWTESDDVRGVASAGRSMDIMFNRACD